MFHLTPLSFLTVLAIQFSLALLITASGFRRLVYFVSVGYAFSILALALSALLIYRPPLAGPAGLHNLLLAAWALRLGIFLLRREVSASYRGAAQAVHSQYARVALVRRVAIWLGVSVLYLCMNLPGLYHSAFTAELPPAQTLLMWLGLSVMLAGGVIEALADQQKSAFKRANPAAFCAVGLYRWVRCPNYLGEILFWSGNWIAGAVFLRGPAAWVLSLAATLCLVLIMLGSTRRLERAQEQRYAALPAYQAYIARVPVLFPWIPLYSLKNIRVYLE